MFETEDMLPRMAPQPSSAISAEAIGRPQVPEVSILFGQPGSNLTAPSHQQQNAQQPKQTTSYAAWKKQMLPKVTFPPNLATEITGEPINNNNYMQGFNAGRSNVYPMRAAAPINGNPQVFNNLPFVASSSNDVYAAKGITVQAGASSQRRSMENGGIYSNTQQHQPIFRRSMEMTPPSSVRTCNSPKDILTICAGTQTDAISSPNANGMQNLPTNLACKQDVDELKQIVEEIRHNQMCLLQMIESYLCSQRSSRPECKDAAVQVECNEKESTAIANGLPPTSNQIPQPTPTNKFIHHLKPNAGILQTPKGKPNAQSTAYRPNSPQSNRLQEYQQVASPPNNAVIPINYQQTNQMAVALPKPSTDKSLVMNELALKYLPNEKLAELLKDLNMASPLSQQQYQISAPNNSPTTPLRNIDNFERGPSDISNASYKYLKKYRLLPEDYIEDTENETPSAFNTSPAQQRQTAAPRKITSPYQQQAGRLPQSPLVRIESPLRNSNMVDLDNIKHQPKFL